MYVRKQNFNKSLLPYIKPRRIKREWKMIKIIRKIPFYYVFFGFRLYFYLLIISYHFSVKKAKIKEDIDFAKYEQINRYFDKNGDRIIRLILRLLKLPITGKLIQEFGVSWSLGNLGDDDFLDIVLGHLVDIIDSNKAYEIYVNQIYLAYKKLKINDELIQKYFTRFDRDKLMGSLNSLIKNSLKNVPSIENDNNFRELYIKFSPEQKKKIEKLIN